jgi:hypothetical protein
MKLPKQYCLKVGKKDIVLFSRGIRSATTSSQARRRRFGGFVVWAQWVDQASLGADVVVGIVEVALQHVSLVEVALWAV